MSSALDELLKGLVNVKRRKGDCLQPCFAEGAAHDGDGLLLDRLQVLGVGGPGPEVHPSESVEHKTMPLCDCEAYNWPHRPGGG